MKRAFSVSAAYYDAIYGELRDYERQARRIDEWISERMPEADSILDMACGTGRHLSELSAEYEVAGVDKSPEMAAIAQGRHPGADIVVADMATVSLERQFDVVLCLFSSITHVCSSGRLVRTLRNFASHLVDGGLCIVETYPPPEEWRDGLIGLRTSRTDAFVVAMVDRADREGRFVVREMAFTVGTRDSLRQFCEREEYGLFRHEEMLQAFRTAGFVVEFLDDGFRDGRGVFIGVLD